jgi:hypothetical protein
VLPTKLPLPVFYRELLNTQRVLYRKHLNWRTAPGFTKAAFGLLMQGQTNFIRGMMLYNKVFNVEKMLADHALPVRYQIPLPPPQPATGKQPIAKTAGLYIHAPRGRAARHIDDSTEQFVDATRVGDSQ